MEADEPPPDQEVDLRQDQVQRGHRLRWRARSSRRNPALFRELFDGLLAGLPWCDCIYFNSLPVDSFTCRYLYSPEGRAGHYFVHPRVMKPRTWLYLEPGESFADFLGSKQKRTRNTLKRRVKKLREHGGGALECTRIEDEDQVWIPSTPVSSIPECDPRIAMLRSARTSKVNKPSRILKEGPAPTTVSGVLRPPREVRGINEPEHIHIDETSPP